MDSIISLAVAGAFGGLLRSLVQWKTADWRERFTNVVIGAAAGYYVNNIGIDVVSLILKPIILPDQVVTKEEGAFVIGIAGPLLFGLITGTISARLGLQQKG